MQRKKTFVLLEILIGFALVSISTLPFLKYPFRHIRQELDMLFEMQITRKAQQRLCEIERQIIQGQLDKSFLFPPEINKSKVLTKKTVAIDLPNHWSRNYEELLKLECGAQRKDDQFCYSLIHIHLSYEKKGQEKMSFHTELVAQKKN